MHPYIYAANNPLNLADTSGESFEQWWKNTTTYWKEAGEGAQILGQIIRGVITGDEIPELAARDVWQGIPNAAKRAGEAIDLPKGMRELAGDAFEEAAYYKQTGQYGKAYLYSFLGTSTHLGSVATDVLAIPIKAGKATASGVEMISGVWTGQRTTGEALAEVGELGLDYLILPRAGKAVSRWLLGDLFVGPCQYSTATCEELRKQFIKVNPDLEYLGKLGGKGAKWGGQKLVGWIYRDIGGGGGGSWGDFTRYTDSKWDAYIRAWRKLFDITGDWGGPPSGGK